MKRYSNPTVISLPVRNCAECPHKASAKHKTANGFGRHYVCTAIRRPFTSRDGSTSYNPSLREALREDGFLPDCPLPDFKGGRK